MGWVAGAFGHAVRYFAWAFCIGGCNYISALVIILWDVYGPTH